MRVASRRQGTPTFMSERIPRRDLYSVTPPSSSLGTLAVGVIAIAALYFARDVFVPLALAVLLSFALGPPVMLLRRWHLGRIPSVIGVVLLAFLVIFAVGSLIGTQLAHLAENLPRYQYNITDKIQSLRGSATGSGIVGRASSMLKDLSSEITKETPAPDGNAQRTPPVATRSGQPQQPIPVEIHQPDPTALQVIQTIVGPLVQPLATTGIVVVFVVFFLLQREDLRDRFIRLAGSRDLHRTTAALDDAARRLSRYLPGADRTQRRVRAGDRRRAGVHRRAEPGAVGHHRDAAALRSVYRRGDRGDLPGRAGDRSRSRLVDAARGPLALFLVAEPVTGQVIEPLAVRPQHRTVAGRRRGVRHVLDLALGAGRAVAVHAADAVPCGSWPPRRTAGVPRHHAGDRPALTPAENFYQRMLASDPDEARDQAEVFLKEKPLSAYYDEVAVGGLALAPDGCDRGVLEHERRVRIKEAYRRDRHDLADHPDAPPPEEAPAARAASCCASPVAGPLDEAAAAMLAQVLEKRRVVARVVPCDAVATEHIFKLDVTDVALVCVSYLEPAASPMPATWCAVCAASCRT